MKLIVMRLHYFWCLLIGRSLTQDKTSHVSWQKLYLHNKTNVKNCTVFQKPTFGYLFHCLRILSI